jgi:hypothetical protein
MVGRCSTLPESNFTEKSFPVCLSAGGMVIPGTDARERTQLPVCYLRGLVKDTRN